ncbi:MAG: type III-B CRISPR module-associated protein Cmr5 [Armatimonadetes bacterium]|nr:type III-B CRISPR module-associated protein Cmr5 [Armatimonadota bacterium]
MDNQGEALQTIEQKRATYALQKVRVQKNTPEYGQLVKGLTAMILTNGLGQALAFLLAKAGKEESGAAAATEGRQETSQRPTERDATDSRERKPEKQLYEDIGDWLVEQEIFPREQVQGEERDEKKQNNWLISRVVGCDRRKYRQATEEVLALLSWMSKFADALMAEGREGEQKNVS